MSELETNGITISWSLGTAKELVAMKKQEHLGVYLEAHFDAAERQSTGLFKRAPAFGAHFELMLEGSIHGFDDATLRATTWQTSDTSATSMGMGWSKLFDPDLPMFFESIYASKNFLTARSSYFDAMFTAGFAEGQPASEDSDARPAKRRKVDSVNLEQRFWADNVDSLEWLPEEWVNEHAELEGSGTGDEKEEEQPTTDGNAGKTTVRIVDCDYYTYRAMLFWLYTEKITFLPPASDFVVELLREGSSDTDAESNSLFGTSPASSYPSRREFLRAGTLDGNGITEPASPHAVYRLADKMDLPELKKLAKEAIIEGFDIENILYELVSSFAYHYEEICDAALSYAWKNWNAVKACSAFDRVVDGAADIEGGTELLGKLMKGLMAAA
ncbi:hypothetical protein JCM8097_008347 [Rhodosporidiobolus ruineniae]